MVRYTKKSYLITYASTFLDQLSVGIICEEADFRKKDLSKPRWEVLVAKEMPDDDYYKYVATRQECVDHMFKGNAEKFAYSAAKAYRFIDLARTDKAFILSNWENLKMQNVVKANYITTGNNAMPDDKQTINQSSIFDAQKKKYVSVSESVAILNSFPLFLYEYLK